MCDRLGGLFGRKRGAEMDWRNLPLKLRVCRRNNERIFIFLMVISELKKNSWFHIGRIGKFFLEEIFISRFTVYPKVTKNDFKVCVAYF